ncbi:MAG: hypothetical protein JWL86_5111 [Rhizobium sp.]|nr:hypothetical protein [Rhizobium sp.]
MFLIKYKLVDLSGNVVEEEILPEIFETPAECDVLIERMSSRYGMSAYDIHEDRWWAREAGTYDETHYWWRSPIMDIRNENVRRNGGS